MAARKVVDIASDLAYALEKRGLTVASASDATSPYLTFGTATTTNNGGSIRIRDFSAAGVDSLGTTNSNFAHTVIQIIVEGSDASLSGNETMKYVQAATIFPVMAQCAAMGCRVELYLSDDGTSPSISELDNCVDGGSTESLLVATFDPSLKSGPMGQQ